MARSGGGDGADHRQPAPARVCDAPEVGVNGTRNCKHEHVAAHTRYPTEVC